MRYHASRRLCQVIVLIRYIPYTSPFESQVPTCPFTVCEILVSECGAYVRLLYTLYAGVKDRCYSERKEKCPLGKARHGCS